MNIQNVKNSIKYDIIYPVLKNYIPLHYLNLKSKYPKYLTYKLYDYAGFEYYLIYLATYNKEDIFCGIHVNEKQKTITFSSELKTDKNLKLIKDNNIIYLKHNNNHFIPKNENFLKNIFNNYKKSN